jgi:hypothetical protein
MENCAMSESLTPAGLISGLTYSVPVDGVIRMGYVVKRQDRRLPAKDDQFTITRKFKDASGAWVPHSLDDALRTEFGETEGNGEKKLRRIPVRIAFDNPSLSISEQFAAFNTDGRPMCVGNGCKAKRRDGATGAVVEVDCPGPDGCDYGHANRCDAFVRLLVQIDHPDAAGCHFILRSGSINAVTDCRTVLESLATMFGGLSGLPMWLTLEAKSSTLSRQSTFWYASLRPRFGDLFEGAKLIQSRRQLEAEARMNRAGYEGMLMVLRNNGAFGETGEDAAQMEDLLIARFTEDTEEGQHSVKIAARAGTEVAGLAASLTERLTKQAQAAKAGGAAGVEATPL